MVSKKRILYKKLNKLHKPSNKRIFIFLDNIWNADLTDMELISKFNKTFRFLLCGIGIFSK